MSRRAWLSSLAMFVLAAVIFSACSQKMQTRSIYADTLFDAGSLEELEDHAKYIVQGKFQDDATEDLQSEAGIVLYGATVSSFEITKVYKGDFEVGDVIKIAEQYYVEEQDGQQTLVHYGNYMPSDVGREYLMFFDNPPENSERWKDTYTPLCLDRGRYPVINAKTRSVAGVDKYDQRRTEPRYRGFVPLPAVLQRRDGEIHERMMDSAGISGGTPARARFKGAFQHPPRLDVPVECDPFAGPIGPAAHADFHAVGPPAPETEIDGDVDAVVLSVLPADISLEHRRNGLDAPVG